MSVTLEIWTFPSLLLTFILAIVISIPPHISFSDFYLASPFWNGGCWGSSFVFKVLHFPLSLYPCFYFIFVQISFSLESHAPCWRFSLCLLSHIGKWNLFLPHGVLIVFPHVSKCSLAWLPCSLISSCFCLTCTAPQGLTISFGKASLVILLNSLDSQNTGFLYPV